MFSIVDEDHVPIAYRRGANRLAVHEAAYREEVQRLVAGALDVLRGSASAELSVREVVRASGLSNKVFYRHFRSKDELLLAILDYGQRTLVGHLERLMGASATPAERVAMWVRGMLDQAAPPAAGPTRPFVLDHARLYSRFPTDMDAAVDAVKAPLVAAIAELPAVDGDPGRAAALTYQLVDGSLQRHLLLGTQPTREEEAAIVDYALRALGGAA